MPGRRAHAQASHRCIDAATARILVLADEINTLRDAVVGADDKTGREISILRVIR